MTERLYYNDPGRLEFEGTITEIGEADGRFFTVLDRSAFYPTSGGQLFDTGLLNQTKVVDVVETDDGTVRHITEEPVGKPGETVTGVVDVDRRRMHRQQHTAQHVISQAFIELYSFESVSVHLGEDYGAIELSAVSVSQEQLDRAEKRANEIIFADHPVEILFVDATEAAQLPLRKIPEREGTIRVIKIDAFDYSACGGTHCDSTAQVGLLKIVGMQKIRGHMLVNFLAGDQLLTDFSNRLEITNTLADRLTCHINDLVEKMQALDDENKSTRRELARLRKELLPSQAARLATNSWRAGSHTLVVARLDDMDAKLAGQLGTAIVEQTGGAAALLVEGRLILAVAPDKGLHAGNIIKVFAAQTGLRGGGGPSQAQVGGANPEQLANYREILEGLLREM